MRATYSTTGALPLAFFAASAIAQAVSAIGTTAVTFQPVTSAGVLEGCSYGFQSIVQDDVYREGQLSVVNGSVTFWRFPEGPALSLKVGIGNLDQEGNLVRTAPAQAFIKSRNGTTARSPTRERPSDTPGFTTYAIGLDVQALKVMVDLTDGSPFQVGFNLRQGGIDVYATVDPEVESTASTPAGLQRKRSPAAKRGFEACMTNLIGGKPN